MSLVQEIGAGLANGNSYVSVADVKAFVGSIALPTATDPEIERAAILATRFLDGCYRARWIGHIMYADPAQPLEWPRVIAPRNDRYINPVSATIPQAIKDATCELALYAITAPLAPNIAPGDRIKREKVDVIETEYVTGNFQTSYPAVDQLISRFLKSSSDAIRG